MSQKQLESRPLSVKEYCPMRPDFHVKTIIQERVNREADAEWGRTPSHEIPKDIKYPARSLPDNMTTRTALYAFLKELKP